MDKSPRKSTQSVVEPKNTDRDSEWLNRKWRPMMAYSYIIICLFDFMIGPIFYQILLAQYDNPIVMWQPLTIQGSGLFHVAMGAILGVSAWSRGMEKIRKTENRYKEEN